MAEKMGNARSTHNTANPLIKINKTSSKPTIHKNKLGAIFGGDFQNWGRTQQNQARKQRGGGFEIVINMAHDTKMM